MYLYMVVSSTGGVFADGRRIVSLFLSQTTLRILVSLESRLSGAGIMGARVRPCPPLCESVGHGRHNRNIEKSRLICVDYVQI